ncbi:hypothetical protein V8E53_013382 [Lactarius tabidus]
MSILPPLSEWLKLRQRCSGNELCKLVSVLGLWEHLPSGFLDTLNNADLTVCYWAAIICYGVTCSVQVPREMQLRAILPDSQGKDTLVSAGTGSSKTLPITLNVLLNDPEKNFHLQVTQELDFNTWYSIPTVVVNKDTPREDSWWNLLIVTVEQLFKSCKGHLPHLAIFLRNQQFQQYVVCIVIDEAHNIHTAGLPHYRLDAFHPAWGRLDELRAILPQHVQWAFPSATFPLHICATIESKLLKPVVNNIKDMKNYECFLSNPFSPESQPCVLISIDKKELACHISAHLDSCLPSEWHNTGIVMHYHSVMLQQYLQLTHDAFMTLTGNCHILVVTLGQSMGVDFLDIKIICTAGLPSMMVDILQCGGRALHNSQDDALFIILYKHWVHDILLDEYNKGDMGDPDCPRAKLKSSSQQYEHVPFSCLKLFSSYLDDTSTAALMHTTTFCCTAVGCDGGCFNLQDLIPGKLVNTNLSPSSVEKPKHNVYCSTHKHLFLKFYLSCTVCPPELILSEMQHASLVCVDPRSLKTAEDITALLQESDKWNKEWSMKVFEVIKKFEKDYTQFMGQSVVQKRAKQT